MKRRLTSSPASAAGYAALCVALLLLAVARPAIAESQGNDYKGISDPFGDPSNYEFSDDEKEDKEFFHLGRYLMAGVDLGVAAFTGGLGKTVAPGFYFGGHLLYFFDKSIALEFGGHYSNHLDSVHPSSSVGVEIDTNMIPINLGLRYFFDVSNAPKAIAIANPWLGAGGGIYMRSQNVLSAKPTSIVTNGSSSSSNFGGYAGGGVQFAIYRKHIYLGLDVRYHFVFFPDADDTWKGVLQPGDRSGHYFTGALSATYNF